jgi:ATP-dependent DNA helicase 2 subunit 2
MREQCIDFEVPQLYNDFLRDLKKQISSGALGGDRREMWSKYIMWPAQGRLGLITKSQCEASDVPEEEAQQVRTTSQASRVQKANATVHSSGRARIRHIEECCEAELDLSSGKIM